MTRWHLLNLPVYWEQAIERWALVDQIWFDWEGRRLDSLVVGRSGFGLRVVQFGPAVRLGRDRVVVKDRSAVSLRPRRWQRALRQLDWEGELVRDQAGHPLGRVKDVDFDPDTGDIRMVWISRGVLADLWQGMLAVDMLDLTQSNEGITRIR